MKINPHDPAYPVLAEHCQRVNESEHYAGLPIRLELAAREPADEVARLIPQTQGQCAAALNMSFQKFDGLHSEAREDAMQRLYHRARLRWADALIAAYNEGQE